MRVSPRRNNSRDMVAVVSPEDPPVGRIPTDGDRDSHKRMDDTTTAIHRVHESNRQLKPDKADPFGMQARLAIARHPVCPLRSLAGKKEKDNFQLEEGTQTKVEEDMTKACDYIRELMTLLGGKDEKSETERKKKLGEQLKEQLKEFTAHMDKPEEVVGELLEDKCIDKTAQLTILAKIYSKLSGIDLAAVRRCAAYTRLVAFEDQNKLQTDRKIKAKYVLYPMFLFFCCFALQSFLLHVTTALYVRYMDRIKDELETLKLASSNQPVGLSKVEGGEMFDLVSHLFVATETGENEAVRDGNVKIPMFILDLSGIIPAGLCVLTFGASAYLDRFHIGLWYKTFLVACCMAIMKGILDLVTVLPDSIGWNQCQARLGDAALQQLRDRRWFSNFWATLWQAIIDEIIGVEGKRMRYCADMMVSGHTYFAALFSLAAYKLTGAVDFPLWAQRLVALVCVLCLILEMVLVAAARFHYTVDMLVSVILVCLLWDSLRMEQWSSDLSEGYNWRDEDWCRVGPWWKLFRLETIRAKPSDAAEDDRAPEEPKVLPSQATFLINLRMLSGKAPWSLDDVVSSGAQETFTNDPTSPTSQRATLDSWRCDEGIPLIGSCTFNK
ncbi:ppdK [Symbiodinium sp. CCMP2456]|nr:ppdK [Symbiodinium sp. CCMP2456]